MWKMIILKKWREYSMRIMKKMEKILVVINKKKLRFIIEKLFNYCLKKAVKIKKYAFKKLVKFSQYQIKKIYYLYDWLNNIKICKGRRFEISASYMKIKRDISPGFKNFVENWQKINSIISSI